MFFARRSNIYSASRSPLAKESEETRLFGNSGEICL